eukprot:316204_1
MSDVLLKQIDDALGRYYARLHKDGYFNDHGEGKFLEYCEANGFDNDDVISEEIHQDVEENMLLDFDENFPFPENQQPENKSQQIWNILKKCHDNPNAFRGSSEYDVFDVEPNHFQDIDEKELNAKIKIPYGKYCKATFAKAEASKDNSLTKLLYISQERIGKPYLHLFADLHARDNIAYYLLIDKIKNEYKETINKLLESDRISITAEKLKSKQWAELNKHTRRIRNWNEKRKEYDLLKAALYSYYHRLCGLIEVGPGWKIPENYGTICRYISEAVDFVYNLANDKKDIQSSLSAICPFQYDFCIAFDD